MLPTERPRVGTAFRRRGVLWRLHRNRLAVRVEQLRRHGIAGSIRRPANTEGARDPRGEVAGDALQLAGGIAAVTLLSHADDQEAAADEHDGDDH